MRTDQEKINSVLRDPETWVDRLNRDYIEREDASFSHHFGTEERYDYDFETVETRTVVGCFIVNHRASMRWLTTIPAELEWTWVDYPKGPSETFQRVKLRSYAWLEDVRVELSSPTQAVILVTYSYENEIEDVIE